MNSWHFYLIMHSIKVCVSHTERYISCPPFKQTASCTSFLGATANTENRECRASWEGALHPSQDTTRAVLEQTRTLVGSTSPSSPGCCLVLRPRYSTRPMGFFFWLRRPGKMPYRDKAILTALLTTVLCCFNSSRGTFHDITRCFATCCWWNASWSYVPSSEECSSELVPRLESATSPSPADRLITL